MSKHCRHSILCRSRRERCCLGGAVLVVLHFRHLRIALSSAVAPRGVSTNSGDLSKSGSPSLIHEGRCCAVSFSSPQNLHSADSCLPTSARQLPRAVWWPHRKRDLHSPLVTAHSVLLLSISLILVFLPTALPLAPYVLLFSFSPRK